MLNLRRPFAAIAAAVAFAAGGLFTAPSAQAASYYCNGNVVNSYDNSQMSVHLIQSYDSSSICVNTWIHTGGQQDTAAYLISGDGQWGDNLGSWTKAGIQWLAGGSGSVLDEGNYSQWASTGWMPDVNRCYYWGGWVGSWKVDGHWWCDLTA